MSETVLVAHKRFINIVPNAAGEDDVKCRHQAEFEVRGCTPAGSATIDALAPLNEGSDSELIPLTRLDHR